MRILTKDTIEKIGEEIEIYGWIHTRRDHGSISFFDLRDRWGLLQVVAGKWTDGDIKSIRPEFVVKITGKVAERPENLRNENIVTGKIELQASKIEVLSEAKTPPFEVDKNTLPVDEELRLKYRYLDLRSERMTRNLVARNKIISFMRNFLGERDFLDIETPFLTKGTPEGAREFIVPSRLHEHRFYVLPQSPQQYKQLLMVGGIDKYFQVARCFRDEDQRGDRQPEFTQFDMEMSFIKEEDVLALVEEMVIALVKKEFPDHSLTFKPFKHLTYTEAMEKYGSDKPDLREDKSNPNELAFLWVTDFPLLEKSQGHNKLVSVHHPFTHPNDEDLNMLDSEPLKVRGQSYDLVLNGFEVAGGSIRIHEKDLQDKIFEILELSKEETGKRFGHLLEAFEYGVPPHGGLAFGLDRLVMLLLGEHNIREVTAFPKTGDAQEPLTGAPTPLPSESLQDVHIKLG